MTADQLGFLVGEAIVFGLIGLAVGRGKGRPVLGFWLGFLIGLIGVIIIACIPRTQAKKMAAAQRQYELQAQAARNAGYPYPPQQPYQPYPAAGQGPYQPYPAAGQGPYQPYPAAGQGPYPQQPGQWQQPPQGGGYQGDQPTRLGGWQQPPPPESWEQQPPPAAWPGPPQ